MRTAGARDHAAPSKEPRAPGATQVLGSVEAVATQRALDILRRLRGDCPGSLASHPVLPYPIPRACMTQRAPPPAASARAMVNPMMAAARFQPSSLPSTATVATQGM